MLALQQSYETNLQSQIAVLEKQALEDSVTPEIRQHLQEQIWAHRKLAERSLEYLAMLLSTKQVNNRLIDEIDSRLEHVSVWKKVSAVGSKAKEVWHFELWVMGDQAVTLKKIVIALFVFIFGLLIVKYFLRVIRSRLLPRTKLQPKPFILFNDFGDSSLVFDVYFWVSINRLMERWKIESDIRFRIDDLFRKADIVIAFPQRDIHLDTKGPLEFKMLDANSRQAEERN